jgi:hypothetical protein
MEELGKKEKMVEKKYWGKNVGTISTAISANSTFHKNVVTFLKKKSKKEKKYCPTF